MTVYRINKLITPYLKKTNSLFTQEYALTYELGKETTADPAFTSHGYGITCFRTLHALVQAYVVCLFDPNVAVYECTTRAIYSPPLISYDVDHLKTVAKRLNASVDTLIGAIKHVLLGKTCFNEWPKGTWMTNALTPQCIVPHEELARVWKEIHQQKDNEEEE